MGGSEPVKKSIPPSRQHPHILLQEFLFAFRNTPDFLAVLIVFVVLGWSVAPFSRRSPLTIFMSDPGADRDRISRLIQTARKHLTSGSSLESRGGSGAIGQNELSLALEQHVRESSLAEGTDPKFVAAEVLSYVKGVLDRTAEGKTSSALSDEEWASLEAIVQVTGRPALRYKDGQVEMPNDTGENEHWAVLIATARTNINRVSGSVGRVCRKVRGRDELVGTAWRIGETLVVTNRHVAARLVSKPTDPISSWKLDSSKVPRVSFDRNPAAEFAVNKIAYCSPEAIDLAVLALDCAEKTPPPPLAIDWVRESIGVEISDSGEERPRFKGKEIYVIGHPYRQGGSTSIAKVFGSADGSKRCSPGYVTSVEGTHLEHDCSTLGGNSGSCVLTTGAHSVVGLHSGSRDVDAWSAMGSANVALAFSRLGDRVATGILRSGRV